VTPDLAYLQIISDNGLGQVASDLKEVDCGTLCNHGFTIGAMVTLTATVLPDTGATFLGWEGDCTGMQPTCTLSMDSSKSVTANWMAKPPRSAMAPVVTLVTPAQAPNSAAVPLVLTGDNFEYGATVSIGGVACGSVNVVSSVQLTCTLPARPGVCGTQNAVVTNPDTLSGTGNKLFRSQSSGFALGPPTSLPAPAQPDRILAVDLDGDGKIDLAHANRSGTIQFRHGNGDGTFAAPKDVATGLSTPIGLVAVDFNKDGKLDLVGTNDSGVTVILNNGGGAFAVAANTAIAGSPDDVAVGDVNGN